MTNLDVVATSLNDSCPTEIPVMYNIYLYDETPVSLITMRLQALLNSIVQEKLSEMIDGERVTLHPSSRAFLAFTVIKNDEKPIFSSTTYLFSGK